MRTLLFIACLISCSGGLSQRISWALEFGKHYNTIQFSDLYTYQWPSATYSFNQCIMPSGRFGIHTTFDFKNKQQIDLGIGFINPDMILSSEPKHINIRDDYYWPEPVFSMRSFYRQLLVSGSTSRTLLSWKGFNLDAGIGMTGAFNLDKERNYTYDTLYASYVENALDSNLQVYVVGEQNPIRGYIQYEFNKNYLSNLRNYFLLDFLVKAEFKSLYFKFCYSHNFGLGMKAPLFGFITRTEFTLGTTIGSWNTGFQFPNTNQETNQASRRISKNYLELSLIQPLHSSLEFTTLNFITFYPYGTSDSLNYAYQMSDYDSSQGQYYHYMPEEMRVFRTSRDLQLAWSHRLHERLKIRFCVSRGSIEMVYFGPMAIYNVWYEDASSNYTKERAVLFNPTAVKRSIGTILDFTYLSTRRIDFNTSLGISADFYKYRISNLVINTGNPSSKNASLLVASGVNWRGLGLAICYRVSLYNFGRSENGIQTNRLQQVLLSASIPIYKF